MNVLIIIMQQYLGLVVFILINISAWLIGNKDIM